MGVNEFIREGEGHCRRKITPALIPDALKQVKALSLPVPRNPSPSSQFSRPWRAVRAWRAGNRPMSSLSLPDFMGNDVNGWVAARGWSREEDPRTPLEGPDSNPVYYQPACGCESWSSSLSPTHRLIVPWAHTCSCHYQCKHVVCTAGFTWTNSSGQQPWVNKWEAPGTQLDFVKSRENVWCWELFPRGARGVGQAYPEENVC